MKTLQLDESGDIAFEKGDFLMASKADEIRQSLFLLLTTNKREWFLDPSMGLDYRAITGKPTDSQIRAAVIEAISQEERVEIIEELVIKQNRQSRHLIVSFRVRIRTGEVLESEVLLSA